MILIIDNYDSFTYNLYQCIGKIHSDVQVLRNDKVSLSELKNMPLKALIISPGPGYPDSSGICLQAIQYFNGKIPILGVCLGHQAIGQVFGGKVVPAKQLMHGKASTIELVKEENLFKDLPNKIQGARYHSLIVDKESLPNCLEILALDETGQIMALKHRQTATYGVQFHPESILSTQGEQLLRNFLSLVPEFKIVNQIPIEVVKEPLLLKPYIFKVIEGQDLTREEAYGAMQSIMNGQATDAQIGSFLTALRMKGETVEELTGFVQVLREKAKQVQHVQAVLDIVGTGGDLSNSFNISTTAAFVVAGAGMSVAKHGNRSVSSRCGAADVLEALGVKIDLSPQQAEQCLQKYGMSFLFAPSFHASMKFAALPRKEIGVRSVFNILGPLANPAQAEYILLGVYRVELLEQMAQVLKNVGVSGAMLVCGADGLDEISLTGATEICELRDGKLIKYSITPEEFGMNLATSGEILGGSARENAAITQAILQGELQGAKRDVTVLNAACALYVAGKVADIQAGIIMAQTSIDSGKALEKLNCLRKYSEQLRRKADDFK